MTLKQSSKQNTIKLTKPVVATEAGEISSTTQDTSLWPDVGGNKVSQGKLALSTSSSTTITNAQTVYPELWENSPVSWQNGADLVIPAITDFENGFAEFTPTWATSTSSVDNITSSVTQCYYSNGEVRVFGFVTLDFNASGNFGLFFPVSELPFGQISPNVTGLCYRTSNPANDGYMYELSGNVHISCENTFIGTNRAFAFQFSYRGINPFNNQTPTISLHDNIAAGALGLPPATDTEAGTVSYYNRVDLVLDNEFTGGTRDITVERIGNTVTITGHGTASHAANATPETSAGFIPSWARPRVTTENVYALEPGRVNAVYVEADGTLSCNYKTWTGADSNAGNVGANRTINIQYNVEE